MLLLLRCLLVALVAVLVSRLVESSTLGKDKTTREFTHIVLIDDTLSMSDRWRDKVKNNVEKNCLLVAKETIKDQLLRGIGGSSTDDRLIVLTKPVRLREVQDALTQLATAD